MFNTLLFLSDLGRGALYITVASLCLIWGVVGSMKSDQSARSWLMLGWRITTFWVIGILINQCLKYGIQAPRPWWINSEIPPLTPHPSKGFGMPSGHTQSAVGLALALWGFADLRSQGARQRLSRSLPSWPSVCIKVMGALWVITIAYARVALHEHSFSQVLVGGLIGLTWASLVLWSERAQRGELTLSLLCLVCIGGGVWLGAQPLNIPPEWSEMMRAHQVEPLSPPPLLKTLILGGASLVCVGALASLKRQRRSGEGAPA